MTPPLDAAPNWWTLPLYPPNDVETAALEAMGVTADEHVLAHLLAGGKPHPGAVCAYLETRDSASVADLRGYVHAGFATIAEVAALQRLGASPADLVEDRGGCWVQRPEWREWQRTAAPVLAASADDGEFTRAALCAQGIPESEHDLVLALTNGRPTPKLVKRYYALRGTDLNPRARTRKLSHDEAAAFADAGFGWLGDIELVVKLGTPLSEVVDASGTLNPDWVEFLDSRDRLRVIDTTFDTGPERTALGADTLLAVVDLETTGIPVSSGGDRESFGNRITEVAVVLCTLGGAEVEVFHTLVDPGPTTTYMGQTYDNYARVDALAEFTGITSESLRGAPGWGEVDATVFSLFSGAVVVGHNLSFERSMFSEESYYLGTSRPAHLIFDTLSFQRRLGKPEGGLSLASVASHHGVEHRHAHSALGDVRANVGVARAQLGTLVDAGVTTLGGPTPLPDGLAPVRGPAKPRTLTEV